MTRESFYHSLNDYEKKFWKEVAERLGKLKYEGETVPKGYVVKDYQPHRGKK
jgi:hypothetical protein